MESRAQTAKLTIGSTSFGNKDYIPERFTCEGENVSPAITIENIPEGTKTLALIVDDPDAPDGTFVHWLLWNVRPMEMIVENTAPGVQGKNSFGKMNYGGPCAPVGSTHRYYFRVFALDKVLDVPIGSSKEILERAMQGHILASGEIIGLQKRTK